LSLPFSSFSVSVSIRVYQTAAVARVVIELTYGQVNYAM